MPYMYALCVCLICMPHMYALHAQTSPLGCSLDSYLYSVLTSCLDKEVFKAMASEVLRVSYLYLYLYLYLFRYLYIHL